MIHRLPAPGARAALAAAALLSGVLLISGCDDDRYPTALTYPPRAEPLVIETPKEAQPTHFDAPGRLNFLIDDLVASGGKVIRPDQLSPQQRGPLDGALASMFGTPAAPKVEGLSEEGQQQLADVRNALRLDETTLAQGSRLYREHCLHCHGLSGAGDGPTGPWVNPHPRDFRRGLFKFTSSSQDLGPGRKPRREDLMRTLREGIDSTAMPSFRLLPEAELEAMTSYVIHLAMRGETEFNAIGGLVREDQVFEEGTPEQIAAGTEAYLRVLSRHWVTAQTSAIAPKANSYAEGDARRASAVRGFKLFTEQGDAGCISCHTDFGRQSTLRYDDWGMIVKPTNLTRPYYRGGRRPIDLYWRIAGGVNGVGMPAFGKKDAKAQAGLTEDQVWDIVNFVQILPYPNMLKDYGIELKP